MKAHLIARHAPPSPRPLLTAALIAAGLLTATQAAHAQENKETQQEAKEAKEAKDRQQLETVTITAQKRPELVTKAPLSVTAIRGETLITQGANDVTSLGALTPGAQFTKNAAGETILTVRGIGSTDVTEVGDPNVAFNLDGVYIGRPAAVAGVLFDIDRVEILRGPQGTLYGRNATSGSVNIITRAPKLGAFGGSAAAEVGNYNAYTLSGAVNVPVGERFALRAAAQVTKRNGFGDNAPAEAHSDDDQKAMRLRAKWLATDTVTVNAGVDYATQGGLGSVNSILPLAAGPYTQALAVPDATHLDRKNEGGFAQVDWELPFATLTYIGSHRENERADVQANPRPGGVATRIFTNDQTQSQNTHELRLGSDEGSLKWVAGLYHFNEKQHTRLAFPRPPLAPFLSDKPEVRAESTAAFGQTTFNVASQLRATVGVRYTRDGKSLPGGEINAAGLIAGSDSFSKTWNSTSWKLGLDYDVNKDTLVYGSAGTGYKAGGYRLITDGTPTGVKPSDYDPEKVTALEVGVKSTLMGGKLLLTAAAFRNDYRDFQVTSFVTVGATPATVVSNAQKAVTQGLEFEAVFRPDRAWRLNASAGLLDAKYKTFRLANGDNFSGAGTPADYSGQRMANAPKLTLNLGAEYRIALDGNAGVITPRLQTHYESGKNVDYHNFGVTSQEGFTKSDVMLTYEAPGRRWTVMGYVRNIENKAVLVNGSPGALSGPLANNSSVGTGSFSAPRMYGIRVAAEF